MGVGEIGLVGLVVVRLVEVVYIQEQESVITHLQRMAETTVDPLLLSWIPRAVIRRNAQAS